MRDGDGTEDRGPEAREAAGWVEDRSPTPPSELMEWLAPHLQGRTSAPGELMKGARSALRRALDEEPGDRGAAFHLLAADALATYACEAAADAGDCGESLEELLREITRRESSEG